MAYEPPDFYEFEPYQTLPVPPPAAHISVPQVVQYSKGPENLKTALLTGAVVSFIFLIAKDAHKAFVRKAHWIPCDFLVLSAFSIQLLSLLNAQNEAVDTSSTMRLSVKARAAKGANNNLWQDFLTIHNSRTILCVFAAYVMPAMADRGFEHAWVRWVALVITVFHHVTSEFYIIKKKTDFPNVLRLWPRQNDKSGPQFYVYATIISLCFILLILLLACATIAGRSIERIVAKKISLVLKGEGEFCAGLAEETEEAHPRPHAHRHPHHHSCWRTVKDAVARGEKAEEEHHRRHCHNCWRTVEDAVLKAWIIVRAYSLQPVIARSALTATAAVIVTIQIVITIVAGLAKEVQGHAILQEKSFKFIASILQSLFILLAWALISLRWAIAVAYYRRRQTDSWHIDFRIEDFWTRHLRELQDVGSYRQRKAQSLDTKIERLVSKKRETVTVPSILLSAAFGMQWLLVSFSKVCWLASLMVFHNKLMCKLFSFLFEKQIMYEFEDYPKYKTILEDVQMLGESSESLWVANRKSIVKAKSLIIQGNQDGECNCDDLVEFLSKKKTGYGLGLSCLNPYKHQTGLKFLCKKRSLQPREGTDLEEQFKGVSRKSWKMTAVSLLSIIVHLSPIYADVDKQQCSTSHDFPPGAVKDCLKAYSQAWEIIDFVEETDTEVDRITSEAADKCFQALQKNVDKGDFPANNIRHATPACVRAALKELKEQSKNKIQQLERVNFISGLISGREKGEKQGRPNGWKGNDSIDWKAAASGLAVYNLCNSIECDDITDVTELLKELESSLADIINECLEKVQQLLLLNSKKWALSRDEKRMGKALYTAGKAKVIMEKLVWNKVAIVSYH